MSESLPVNPRKYFSNFVQIGVVVRNLDHSVKNLVEIFGLGPFRVIDWPPKDRLDIQKYYHGEPGNFTARMAFTELGPVELELIQPVEGQSAWADFLHEHGEGIHHIRFNVDDLPPVQEYLAQFGIHSIQHGSGLRPGTTWMNFGSEAAVGFVIEMMKIVPGSDGRTPRIIDGEVQA